MMIPFFVIFRIIGNTVNFPNFFFVLPLNGFHCLTFILSSSASFHRFLFSPRVRNFWIPRGCPLNARIRSECSVKLAVATRAWNTGRGGTFVFKTACSAANERVLERVALLNALASY